MLKLVCLEILIVVIGTRAMFQLMGKTSPLPDLLWAAVGLLAAVAAASFAIAELLAQSREGAVPARADRRIPLERIGPYSREAIAARAQEHRHSLN